MRIYKDIITGNYVYCVILVKFVTIFHLLSTFDNSEFDISSGSDVMMTHLNFYKVHCHIDTTEIMNDM